MRLARRVNIENKKLDMGFDKDQSDDNVLWIMYLTMLYQYVHALSVEELIKNVIHMLELMPK